MCEFPYAGLSISFLAMDSDTNTEMLDRALNNISIEDVEMLYNYDVENIPVIVKSLRERGLDRDLIKSVFEI